MKRIIVFAQLCLFLSISVFAQETSIRDVEKKAKSGDVEAMLVLGDKYAEAESFKTALKWYKKATEKGSMEAQYAMAMLYLEGNGISRNTKKAYEYIQDLAVKNYADAQFCMGGWYEKGLEGYEVFLGVEMDTQPKLIFVNPDKEKAVNWYAKAAALGNQKSVKRLIELERIDVLPADIQAEIIAKKEAEQRAREEEEKAKRFNENVKELRSSMEFLKNEVEKFEKDKKMLHISAILSNINSYSKDSVEFKKIRNEAVKGNGEYADIMKRIDSAIIESDRIASERGHFYDDVEWGEVWKKDGKLSMYLNNGTVVCRNLSRIASPSTLHPEFFVWDANGKQGFVNEKGKLVVPFGKYTDVIGSHVTAARMIIIVVQGKKRGAVDYNTGKQIIAPIYDEFIGSGLDGKMLWLNKTNTGFKGFILNNTGNLVASKSFTLSQNYAFAAWTMDYLGKVINDVVKD